MAEFFGFKNEIPFDLGMTFLLTGLVWLVCSAIWDDVEHTDTNILICQISFVVSGVMLAMAW